MKLRLLTTICCLIFLFTAKYLQAQVPTINGSEYTYIYRLNKEQVRWMIDSTWLNDKNWILTNLVDSVKHFQGQNAFNMLKMEKFDRGYYMSVNAYEENITPSLFIHQAFFMDIKEVNGLWWLTFKDSMFNVVKNGQLTMIKSKQKDTLFGYDSSCFCYPVPLQKQDNWFLFEAGGDFYYVFVHSPYKKVKKGWFRWLKRKRKTPYSDNYYSGWMVRRPWYKRIFPRRKVTPMQLNPGYIVINQPEYKQYDTLKMKSFLVTRKGKPRKEKLYVKVYYTQDPGHPFVNRPVKPSPRGVYTFEMAIPDTFILDQNYSISLCNKKGQVIKSATFKVSDYELKKVTYDWVNVQPEYYRGKKIIIYGEAKDANGLPLPDATLKLKMKLLQVNAFYDTLLILHDSLFTRFFDTTVQMSPDGPTPIEIPERLIPNADIVLQGEMEFMNSDNQPGKVYRNMQIVANSRRYYIKQDSLGLRAGYLVQGSDVEGAKAYWEVVYASGIKVKKEISLPYYQNWESGATEYILYDSAGVWKQNFTNPQQNPFPPIFIAKKTYDSLFVKLNNPLNLEVSWRISAGKKLVYKGAGASLDYKTAHKGLTVFYVVYSYMWRGQLITQEQVVYLKEKELTVKIKQEETIYPGQEVPVEITVTDYKNRPVRKVNLTAYSVNMEFENIQQPQMPYYGKLYGNTLSVKAITATQWFNYSPRSYPLSHPAYSRLQLYRQPYYQLLYNKTAIGLLYDTLTEGKTQLSFFANNGRYGKGHYAVWVDDTLLYYGGTNLVVPNACTISPGRHTISVRTSGGFYNLGSLFFHKGLRTLVGLHTDSISVNPEIKHTTAPAILDTLEKVRYEENILLLGSNWNENNRRGESALSTYRAYIRQGTKLYRLSMHNYLYSWSNKVYDNFYAIGPLEAGNVELVFPGDTIINFYFTPGYLYQLTNRSVRLMEESRIFLSFPPLNQNYNFNDTAVELPRNIESTEQPVAEPKTEFNPFIHPGLNNYSVYGYKKGSTYHLHSHNVPRLNKLWLINRDSLQHSKVLFYGPNNNIQQIQAIQPGYYDFIYLTDTHSYKIIPHQYVGDSLHIYHHLQPNGFAAFDTLALFPYMEIIKLLNREPVPEFYKTPVLLRPTMKKQRVKTTQKITGELSINDNYIGNALVVLEQNGKFITAGLTNRLGYYEFIAPAGKYTLKAYTPQWDMFYVENVDITAGYNTIARLNIINYSSTVIMANYYNLPDKQKREQKNKNGSTPQYGTRVSGTCTANCGEIRGKVTDESTGEPIAFATVTLINDERNVVAGTTTDIDGNYLINKLKPGQYGVTFSYVAYQAYKVGVVTVSADKITYLNAAMKESRVSLEEVVVSDEAMNGFNTDAYLAEGDNMIFGSNAPSASYTWDADVKAAPLSQMETTMKNSMVTIAGARSSSSSVYWNGAAMSGEEADDYNPFRGNVFREKEKDRLAQMVGDTTAMRTRKTFRDYGYWIPNLTTNKQGISAFSVRFPDNQTQWITYVPAMDGKTHTGLGIAYTKAYKPLTANLGLPRFMVAGDRLEITGKSVNYTPDSVIVNALLRVNDSTLYNSPMGIKYYELVKQLLVAAKADTLLVNYSIKMENGYFDGEEREIPVIENGLMVNVGEYKNLENDTAFTLQPQAGMKNRELILSNRRMEMLQVEIDKLKNYRYGCVEQTASKLLALLLEKKYAPTLNREFTGEKQVKDCIKRLEKFQNEDGSWGWWEKSPADKWMTIYATKAILRATQEGYRSSAHVKGMQFLMSYGPATPDILELMAQMKMPETKYQLNRIYRMNFSLQDRFLLIKSAQQLGENVNIDTVLRSVRYIGDKQAVWGEKIYNISVNELQTSALAYEILRAKGGYDTLLKKVRNYFLSKPAHVRNTIESATLLQTFIADVANEGQVQQELKPAVTVNGENVGLPLRKKIGQEETVSVTKKGSEVFYIYKGEEWKVNPEKLDSIYTLETTLWQNGRTTDTLKAGVPVTMKVHMHLKKPQEYVMLEVPIPAGFSYESKLKGYKYGELYREHFDEKVAMFFNKLEWGEYYFEIKLLPKFKGQVTLLPAKAEQMYFPVFYGNNTKRTIVVE